MENFLKKVKLWQLMIAILAYMYVCFMVFSYLEIFNFISIFIILIVPVLITLKWRTIHGVDNKLVFGKTQYINIIIAFVIFMVMTIMLGLALVG